MKIDIETSPVDDSIETNTTEEKTKNIFHKIKNLITAAFFIPTLYMLPYVSCLQDVIPGLCISLMLALLWRMSLHDSKIVRFIPYFILLLLFCLPLLIRLDSYLYMYIIALIILGVPLFTNNEIARSLAALIIILFYSMTALSIIDYATGAVMKPIIYLYPESKIDVSVELGNAYKISHSYPKYEKVWNVVADSNSNILYNERNYYGLYWEGKGRVDFDMNDGFVVKGSDSAKFLEEKLALLGLSEREANEFIIYWLPKLESNAYNFIKFASIEAQNEYMPLSISPKPNTIIRVLMGYKGLNKKIEVKEQILPSKPERSGFVAVEWGGTEIGDNIVY